jgi:hypothetical protein
LLCRQARADFKAFDRIHEAQRRKDAPKRR